MTTSVIELRLALLSALFLICLNSIGQEGLLASNQGEISADNETSITEEAILVDRAVKSSAYPSMEEEMAMYIALRTSEPKAFFFPNPSKGVVWIEHNLGREANLEILDKEGQLVFSAAQLQVKKLDLTTFKEGQYTLVLSNHGKSVRKTLIVQ